MTREDESWPVAHEGRLDWHSDGRCWIRFRRHRDGLGLDAHGRDFADAMLDARKLDGAP